VRGASTRLVEVKTDPKVVPPLPIDNCFLDPLYEWQVRNSHQDLRTVLIRMNSRNPDSDHIRGKDWCPRCSAAFLWLHLTPDDHDSSEHSWRGFDPVKAWYKGDDGKPLCSLEEGWCCRRIRSVLGSVGVRYTKKTNPTDPRWNSGKPMPEQYRARIYRALFAKTCEVYGFSRRKIGLAMGVTQTPHVFAKRALREGNTWFGSWDSGAECKFHELEQVVLESELQDWKKSRGVPLPSEVASRGAKSGTDEQKPLDKLSLEELDDLDAKIRRTLKATTKAAKERLRQIAGLRKLRRRNQGRASSQPPGP